eukprot:CAMPEP_0119384962 /NCGR_PEP_ID=MMETSP1334-20130426/88596_1 /TAXON_ID=127549 /ORGANISM="Calcidiscus leptoporus, Strain RCC1130" /LENGTH=81 /DNA_ID=CAMNT_0007406137 /DNA_START=262 /DNA_END=507 /DNA_ORIENTATION=-
MAAPASGRVSDEARHQKAAQWPPPLQAWRKELAKRRSEHEVTSLSARDEGGSMEARSMHGRAQKRDSGRRTETRDHNHEPA